MKKHLTVAVMAALAVPSSALAHDGGTLKHKNEYLRAKVIKLGASPGRDIVEQGRRKQDSSVKEYLATMRRMVAPPPAPAPAPAAPAATSSTTTAAPATGGCGSLPAYIVERESGGDPNAVSPDGQYVGCAQVDTRHFGEWGTCVGMAYTACVDKLWDGGNGASNWPTAANPPQG